MTDPVLPFLSVIIPAFNEEARLPATLDRILAFLERWESESVRTFEVIVVDDGSSDATAEVVARAQRAQAELHHLQPNPKPLPIRLVRNGANRGKGFSFRYGFSKAAGEWVLMSDADLSTPIEEVEKLLHLAAAGSHDLVIGSRALPDSVIEEYQPFHRWFMGQTFNRLVRLMTRLPIHDTQCGFKLMRRVPLVPVVKRMKVDRFAFDVELLYLARRAGLSTLEAPVSWKNAPGSRVGLIGDPLNMLADIARFVRRENR